MALFDKLAQRGMNRLGRNIPQEKQASILGVPVNKPLPAITDTLNAPPVNIPVSPAVTQPNIPVTGRLAQLPQKGTISSMPQFAKINKRFVADLPANIQLQGITKILAGESVNPQIDSFVKGLAAQGKTPEEIRQAFLMQQKTSPNPLVIL